MPGRDFFVDGRGKRLGEGANAGAVIRLCWNEDGEIDGRRRRRRRKKRVPLKREDTEHV